MRYRKLTETGDYTFGVGGFLVDTPEAVVQAVYTRLMLWTGEWFLDLEEGTPYTQTILGYGTQSARDAAIRDRILSTPGVLSLLTYNSSATPDRKMTVTCSVETEYGPGSINTVLG